MEKSIRVKKSIDFFMLLISVLNVLSGLLQLFDFYSDIAVLYVVYRASFMVENEEFVNDY